MSGRALQLVLAEVPRDVLVWLVDNGPADLYRVAREIAPLDVSEQAARSAVGSALRLLDEIGFVSLATIPAWRATASGHAAVDEARRVHA